jgi:hypothetical protein
VRDEPNASMASGMVLKAGLVVPFGCCWGAIVGGWLRGSFLGVLGSRSSDLFNRSIDRTMVCYPRAMFLGRKVPMPSSQCLMSTALSFGQAAIN